MQYLIYIRSPKNSLDSTIDFWESETFSRFYEISISCPGSRVFLFFPGPGIDISNVDLIISSLGGVLIE